MESYFNFVSSAVHLKRDLMRLLVFASFISLGLCAGEWSVQDPTEKIWCDKLRVLYQNNLIYLPSNGCPQILAVEQQLVSGTNTRYTMNVNQHQCELVVYEQVWTNTVHITRDTCHISVQIKRQVGGWHEQDPTDQHWFDKLHDLENKGLLLLTNSVQIVKVATQVVSGTNTKFTLNVNQQPCELTIFEQVWMGITHIITDTCHLSVQHKRQLVGGWHEQDPSGQEWFDILHSLEKNGLLQSLVGVRVVGVSTQVVNGLNIKYKLVVHMQQCEMHVYQSWTQTLQITSDACHISVQHKRQVAGGWQEQDPTDQQWYDKLHNLEKKGLLVSTNGVHILKVATQVVSGENIKYTLLINGHQCEVVIYEQSWTNTYRVTSDTCPISVQHKRQLVGGWHEQDPTGQEWYDKLHALEKSGLLHGTSGAKILKVETQVVNGKNTRFTLWLNGHECVLTIHESSSNQPASSITSNTCVSVQKYRQLLGGIHPVSDINGEGVQGCIALTLDRINLMSNSMFRLVEFHIISATEQVVAGTKYTIKLQTQVSSCMNSKENMGLTSTSCPVNTISQMQPSTWTTTCIYQAYSTPKVQVLDFHMAH